MFVIEANVKKHGWINIISRFDVSKATFELPLVVRDFFRVGGVHVTVFLRTDVDARPALHGSIAVQALILGGRLLRHTFRQIN
jgi:hypothetical protein